MAPRLEGLWQPHCSWHEPGSWDLLSSQRGCIVTSASAGYWALPQLLPASKPHAHLCMPLSPCTRHVSDGCSLPGLGSVPKPWGAQANGKARSHCPPWPQDLSFSWTFPILRPSEASLASCHYHTDCFRTKRSPLLLWPAVSSPGPRAAAPLAVGPCRPFPCWRRVVTELRGSKA